MAIELISAEFAPLFGTDEEARMQTPFAAIRSDLGQTSVLEASNFTASPTVWAPDGGLVTKGVPPRFPAVLVANMIRGKILKHSRPLAVRAKLRYTGGDVRARVSIGSPIFGHAEMGLNFDSVQEQVEVFEFDKPELLTVGSENLTLSWRITQTGAADVRAETTHRVLITLGDPGPPWSLSLEDESRWLWLEVLEKACDWARGADSIFAILEKITRAVYALGQVDESIGLRYGPGLYCVDEKFLLGNLLRHLDGEIEIGSTYVNCEDLATIVSTFANALGCDLCQSQCGACDARGKGFALGNREFTAFQFHELAWSGTGAMGDLVADACLSTQQQVAMAPMPFRQYAGKMFQQMPAIIGQSFEQNRQVTGKPVELGKEIELRAQSRHHQLRRPADPAILPESWIPEFARQVPAFVNGEQAWEFFPGQVPELLGALAGPARDAVEVARTAASALLRLGDAGLRVGASILGTGELSLTEMLDNLRVLVRLSVFESSEKAWTFLCLMVGGSASQISSVDAPGGVAFLTDSGKALFYLRGRQVIAIRLRLGVADLQALFNGLIALFPQ